MINTNELKDRVRTHARMAKNILANKGSQKWTVRDQLDFDTHMEAAEAASASLTAIQDQQQSAELFVRKAQYEMTAVELKKIKNTMSTTTGSQGGFAVSAAVMADIMSVVKDPSPMRRASSQILTENGDDMGYPTSNGSTEVGEQVSQNATATAIDPTFGNASLSVYKFSSKIFAVPWELLQDAQADVLAFVGQRAMDRIGRIQNQKFTTGSGTGEPTGFVTAATVGKIGTTGQTLTIIYDDLVDMIESVDAGHTSLTWMMSQQMRSIVRRIKDATTSRPVWIPEFEDTGASLGGSLLGYPVWINNDMATPAANAKTVAFGNFEKYMIRDAMEFTLFRFDDSPYTKLGQVGFLAWMRSGGNLIDTAAVKTYQHSAT